MISKIIFNKITFNNLDYKNFDDFISKKGFFVFPAGPALATIKNSSHYYKAIQKADLVFFDSGFFVILLRFFKGIKVNKFSGYKFIELFLKYIKKNKRKVILCIDPNFKYSQNNKILLSKLGVKKVYNYIAPKYNTKNIKDLKLVNLINTINPDFVLNNIGGGTQEILGLYLRERIKYKTTIICTGAAISFFTGDQAPINNFIDRLYLGWLARLIFNPITFFKRYLFALRLIPLVKFNKIQIKNDKNIL